MLSAKIRARWDDWYSVHALRSDTKSVSVIRVIKSDSEKSAEAEIEVKKGAES